MSLVSRYRLQFLVAWLAMDARVRVHLSPRQIPSVVGLLPLARVMEQALHPWLVAVLTRRERLAWTLHPPRLPEGLAAQVRADAQLEPFALWELRCWQTAWLRYLLEAELARLVRLLEAPGLVLSRPGWEHWEVARWALATCLARIGQLTCALENEPRAASRYTGPKYAGLRAALEAAWQRLAVAETCDVFSAAAMNRVK
jgi:hypothetical protein